MRLVLEVYNDGRHLANDSTSLKGEGLYRKHTVRKLKIYSQLLYFCLLFLFPSLSSSLSFCASLSPSLSLSLSLSSQLFAVSDPEDYKRLYKESQMYRHVDAHVNLILLNITISPRPEEPLNRDDDRKRIGGAGEKERGHDDGDEEEEVKSKPSTGGRIMKVVSKVEEEKGKKRGRKLFIEQSVFI